MSLIKTNNVVRENEKDDYKMQTSTRQEIIFIVISVLIAVILWAYAIQSDSSTHLYTGKTVEIDQTSSDNSYIVSEIDSMLVDFKVMGRKDVISNLTDSDIKVYADLSKCTTAGTYYVDIIFESNYALYFYGKSADKIKVTVTEK